LAAVLLSSAEFTANFKNSKKTASFTLPKDTLVVHRTASFESLAPAVTAGSLG
jgi:hypothetical protein